jgi:chromosome segregation ATPase
MSTRHLEKKIEKLETRNAGQLVELSKKGDAIKHLGVEVRALRDQLRTELDVKATAAREAERALSEKESELARLRSALDERSALADPQKAAISALTMEVQTLQRQLAQAGEEAKAAEDRRDAALRDLSEKESALVQLTTGLNERSVLVDSQKAENAALRMQSRMLNERLVQAGKEARAVEECRDTERRALNAAAQNLMEERSKFEGFHRRVTDLVQQVTAQRTEDEVRYRRVREELENRLIEQSRLLNDSQSELIHLRREIKIARKAEDDLHVANAATQNLIADKAKLQAALDRANGDRARLGQELANLKRRQADQARAAERVDNATVPERVNDIAAERARRAAHGRLSRRANS